MAKKKNKKPAKKAGKPKKKAAIKRKGAQTSRKPVKGSKRSKGVKKRAVKLKPMKRTIVRKKNKNGRFYYYNKRKGKMTSKRAWKGLNTRVRTRNEQIKAAEKRLRKRRVKRAPKKKKEKVAKKTRFHRLQRIFKKYLDVAKIKVGKRFNEYVGNIYRETLKVSLKEIERHAAELWDKYSGFAAPPPPPPTKVFPESFPFYNARDEFNKEVFDDVKIIVSIHDPDNGFDANFEGTSEEFSQWYSFSGALAHLRKYYNESPPAFFVLTDNDGRTFARYEAELGVPIWETPPAPTPEPPKVPPAPPAPPTPPTPEPEKPDMELEKEKQKTFELREKAMARELELIKEWKALGLSAEEIKERLKKFREGGEI